MSLKPLIKLMEELHSASPDERDGWWACDLNNARLMMHHRIISTFPSSKEVQIKVLPLFYRSIGALESLPQNPQDSLAYHVPGFLENFRKDIRELEEYVVSMQEHYEEAEEVA